MSHTTHSHDIPPPPFPLSILSLALLDSTEPPTALLLIFEVYHTHLTE